ncbi:MAG: Gfo/Idh/MocA family oxidoreductase [Halosimplex sp.]
MSDHRCVLLGCGHRGRQHARAIADSDRLTLAAVCDRDVDQAESVAAEFDVPVSYTDLDEALATERPHHVSAVTSPRGRVGVVRNVLDHEPESLLIEKPVANTLTEVEEIAELAADAETRVTVCHQKPYADEFRALKGWIDEGRFGETERLVGSTKGGLTGQGTHFLHALDWFVDDEPTAVRGFAEGPVSLDPTANPWVVDHAEPEDTAIELSYPDGVRGFVHLGPGAPDVPAQADTFWYEFRIDVVGTDGRGELVLGDHAKGVFADGTEYVEARDFEEDAYMTRHLYDDLAAVLSGERDSHLADLESAVAVHRTVDAAMRSALDGRTVAPSERPLDVGRPTTERLRRHLVSRRPVCAASSLFGEYDRDAAFRALADLGVTRVNLWSVPGVASHFDPAADDPEAVRSDLAAHDLAAPVVSVGGPDAAERIRFASELGADSVVFDGHPGAIDEFDAPDLRSWLDAAAECDLSGTLVPGVGVPAALDEFEALVSDLDGEAARVAVAPPTLLRAGESPAAALAAFGDRVDAVYLWDTEPGRSRRAATEGWDHADSQVPGGGSAVDFDALLDTAVDTAPNAERIVRYHGVDDWGLDRITGSLARALRAVERTRT